MRPGFRFVAFGGALRTGIAAVAIGALCNGGIAAAQKNAPAPASGTRLYHGEWFDVTYPAVFTSTPPSRKTLQETGSDEATFTSPDGRVSFYVFSPQWNGKPSFVTVAPTEKEVSRRVQTSKDAARIYTTKAIWVTVEAKNKSYTRTWEDVETSLNTRRVTGVKYKTEADFKRYRAQYLAFKKSLKQFGD